VTTVFHLVRHADHDQLGKVLTGRSAEARLSALGRARAQALASRFSKMHVDAILTSPQARAYETAVLAFAETDLNCEVSQNLDEIDFGSWAGQPFEKLDKNPAWRAWNDDRSAGRTPGGETMGDVAARLVALIDELRGQFCGGTVALVSHGDVIKAGVCHYLRLPFQRVHSFEVSPASLTTIAVHDRGGVVLRLNEGASSLSSGEVP
jgi:probable phosphoglycerate mutase